MITESELQALRLRVLDVFDDLRRAGLAIDPSSSRGVLHGATHLTFVHVERGSTRFIAFWPVRADIDSRTLIAACELRGVTCEWEGGGHLALISRMDPQTEIMQCARLLSNPSIGVRS